MEDFQKKVRYYITWGYEKHWYFASAFLFFLLGDAFFVLATYCRPVVWEMLCFSRAPSPR